MADETSSDTPPAEGEEAPKKSFIANLLPKILLPLVAVVGIGLGVGVTMFLRGGSETPPPAAEGGKADKEAQSSKEESVPAGERAAAPETPKVEEEVIRPEEPSDAGEAPADAGGGEGADALMVKLDPMVVNIFEKNSIHYLKIQLEVLADSPETVADVAAKKAKIRDRLLFIFSDISMREALSTGGKALIKEDIQAAINKVLGKGKIMGVYFTDFTVQ